MAYTGDLPEYQTPKGPVSLYTARNSNFRMADLFENDLDCGSNFFPSNDSLPSTCYSRYHGNKQQFFKDQRRFQRAKEIYSDNRKKAIDIKNKIKGIELIPKTQREHTDTVLRIVDVYWDEIDWYKYPMIPIVPDINLIVEIEYRRLLPDRFHEKRENPQIHMPQTMKVYRGNAIQQRLLENIILKKGELVLLEELQKYYVQANNDPDLLEYFDYNTLPDYYNTVDTRRSRSRSRQYRRKSRKSKSTKKASKKRKTKKI